MGLLAERPTGATATAYQSTNHKDPLYRKEAEKLRGRFFGNLFDDVSSQKVQATDKL
jgi:hypothetical protein